MVVIGPRGGGGVVTRRGGGRVVDATWGVGVHVHVVDVGGVVDVGVVDVDGVGLDDVIRVRRGIGVVDGRGG